jgi:pimeloyl-ACP methyl ester carboxylesterase
MVPVEGRAMRVWTLGVEQRKPGQPVVILESGTGGGLETWKPVFAEIARLAPVLAYDRRGVGQSEPDSVTPTLHRVAQSLHALLQQMSIPPPYVLVGHSWGGAFVRSFSDVYPAEVAGLVFLDVTDFVSTREEKASRGPAC